MCAAANTSQHGDYLRIGRAWYLASRRVAGIEGDDRHIYIFSEADTKHWEWKLAILQQQDCFTSLWRCSTDQNKNACLRGSRRSKELFRVLLIMLRGWTDCESQPTVSSNMAWKSWSSCPFFMCLCSASRNGPMRSNRSGLACLQTSRRCWSGWYCRSSGDENGPAATIADNVPIHT